MASPTVLLMEAANLFIGDADPEASKHLALASVALPTLERVVVDHMGGGAVAEVGFSMNVLKKLTPTFKLAGFDRDAYREFGIGSGLPNSFTIYGVIRDKRTNIRQQAKAVIWGSITRLAADAFDRSNILGHDHNIEEVTHYELHLAGQEWYHYDWSTTVARVFGIDEMAEVRIMLGLQ